MTIAQQLHQEGAVVSRRQDVLEVLTVRFGKVPRVLEKAISMINDEVRLKVLHRAAITVDSLKAFAASL